MKYNSIVFAVLLSIFTMLFSSCVKKREYMYHFSQSDSLFFNIFDTLQSYYFKTNHGIDTLRFTKKHIEENYNEWYIDMVDGAIFNAFFYSEGVFCHNGSDEDFYFSYKKEADGEDPVLNVIVGERYAMPIDDLRNFIKHGVYKDTIVIDNKNSHQNHYEPHRFTFDYLIWHKYKGIIGYKLSDGTVYPE